MGPAPSEGSVVSPSLAVFKEKATTSVMNYNPK